MKTPTPTVLFRVWYFNHKSSIAASVEMLAHDRDEACAGFHRQYPIKTNHIRKIEANITPDIIIQTPKKPRKGGL